MVQVTNDPQGRTYTIWSTMLDPYIGDSLLAPTDEYIDIDTPYVVPNGKWVMEWYYGGHPVGVTREEIEEVDNGLGQVLWVSDKPFGCVRTDAEDRKTLVYARQVWKGELGHGVNTPKLDYVREPLASHRGLGMKARERRRGQYGWVKLAELGEITVGYSPDKQVELVLGYWQFSGHRNYRYYENDQDGGQLVDVAWGSSLDIELGTAEFKSLTQEQFREECSDTSEVWIRRGFAYTILRLQALGVQPEVTHPA